MSTSTCWSSSPSRRPRHTKSTAQPARCPSRRPPNYPVLEPAAFGHWASMEHSVAAGEVLLRVLLALVPAALIGIERELGQQPAGLRTHVLVALGACLFTLAGSASPAAIPRGSQRKWQAGSGSSA